MFNAIENVKRQYMPVVQPVKLFENKNSQTTNKANFEFITNLKTSGNNPFHPDISNSEKGSRLDIIS